ncbi:MAG: ABC transporter substrate-binding protein [Desulfurivibrio sp.]|nr:MAG: ABC transporter substrate-binding protein [Desulfurivibrio sp.]
MTARIGMVNFINTAPLYVTWQQRVARPDWLVTEGAPTTLNRMLCANELDLGFVSSHEYAAHPHLYRILEDISISSSGPVGSVFLFSRLAPEELAGRTVRLSTQSQTSVALVKIILEEFYKVQPVYQTGNQVNDEEMSGVLAIGDEALRLKTGRAYPFCLDLGETWQQHTGLPFVFAVWAVREDFLAESPGCVSEIRAELLSCIREGKEKLQAVCTQVAPRIPMDVDSCYKYLCGIEYDLTPQKMAALTLFFDYLIKRGEAQAAALPIKVCR